MTNITTRTTVTLPVKWSKKSGEGTRVNKVLIDGSRKSVMMKIRHRREINRQMDR